MFCQQLLNLVVLCFELILLSQPRFQDSALVLSIAYLVSQLLALLLLFKQLMLKLFGSRCLFPFSFH